MHALQRFISGRNLLITLAWLVFALFLVFPLYVVISEALAMGVNTFWQAIIEPDTISALKLT